MLHRKMNVWGILRRRWRHVMDSGLLCIHLLVVIKAMLQLLPIAIEDHRAWLFLSLFQRLPVPQSPR